MNEFYGKDNKIGILPSEPDPINYFSIEHKEYQSDTNQAIVVEVILDENEGENAGQEEGGKAKTE